MIRAVAARILRKILLVIVLSEEESATEITRLHRRCWRIGRLPVDVASIPAVDRHVHAVTVFGIGQKQSIATAIAESRRFDTDFECRALMDPSPSSSNASISLLAVYPAL